MNVRQLKELIKDLPDDVIIYQETGDHFLYPGRIEWTNIYDDEDYGTIEAWREIEGTTRVALIIR